MTSGGKRKPAKADCGTGAGRGRRVLMQEVSLLEGGHGERNSASRAPPAFMPAQRWVGLDRPVGMHRRTTTAGSPLGSRVGWQNIPRSARPLFGASGPGRGDGPGPLASTASRTSGETEPRPSVVTAPIDAGGADLSRTPAVQAGPRNGGARLHA